MRFIEGLRSFLSPPPLYPGPIPPLLYLLHPAIGVRPVQPGARAQLPGWWHELPEEVWEQTLHDWLHDVMLAVTARGDGKLYIEFSDRLGFEAVARLPECENSPPGAVRFVCDTTPTAIDALLQTNMSLFVQTVGTEVVLYGATCWDDGVFLCVHDEDLVRRFREAVLRPRE